MAITNVQPLPDVSSLVDLERYPIHDLENVAVRELIEAWRVEFNDTGACNLQGFIRQEGVAELAAEAFQDAVPYTTGIAAGGTDTRSDWQKWKDSFKKDWAVAK